MTVNELIETLQSLPDEWKNDQVICFHEIGSFLDSIKTDVNIDVDVDVSDKKNILNEVDVDTNDNIENENNDKNELDESYDDIDKDLFNTFNDIKKSSLNSNKKDFKDETKNINDIIDDMSDEEFDAFASMAMHRFMLGPVETVSRISVTKTNKRRNLYELSTGAIILE